MKNIRLKNIGDTTYSVLDELLEEVVKKYSDHEYRAYYQDMSVTDLLVDENGDVHFPSDFIYEQDLVEIHGSKVDMGGWKPSKYTVLVTKNDLITKILQKELPQLK